MNNGKIDYTDFDRIQDTLMFFDAKFSLGFVTRLSKKDVNGYRKFYEFETEYPSNAYKGVDIGRSVKRIMNFYYIIENKESFTSSMVLLINDVYVLENIIKSSILPWFFGSNRIYTEKDDKLVITGTFTPVSFVKDLQHWLNFEPIVIEYEDGTYKEGIRMFVNDNSEFVDMNLDRFIEFTALLDHRNMYIQSMAQCNYIKIAPYTANNLVLGGGLGSGGGNPNVSERMAENKYGLGADTKNNSRTTNSFLDKAKKKGE